MKHGNIWNSIVIRSLTRGNYRHQCFLRYVLSAPPLIEFFRLFINCRIISRSNIEILLSGLIKHPRDSQKTFSINIDKFYVKILYRISHTHTHTFASIVLRRGLQSHVNTKYHVKWREVRALFSKVGRAQKWVYNFSTTVRMTGTRKGDPRGLCVTLDSFVHLIKRFSVF